VFKVKADSYEGPAVLPPLQRFPGLNSEIPSRLWTWTYYNTLYFWKKYHSIDNFFL